MNRCPDCGKHFICGVQKPEKDAPCWCMQLPPLLPLPEPPAGAKAEASHCYCPDCLQRRGKAKEHNIHRP